VAAYPSKKSCSPWSAVNSFFFEYPADVVRNRCLIQKICQCAVRDGFVKAMLTVLAHFFFVELDFPPVIPNIRNWLWLATNTSPFATTGTRFASPVIFGQLPAVP